MKLNWGTGIAIFYGAFVIIMISMVVMSSRQDINMVQDDYYDKDLHYEAFRQSKANEAAMPNPVRIAYQSGGNIMLQFPEGTTIEQGEVTLYRPSNRKMDRQLPLKLDQKNSMEIATDRLVEGPWKVMLNWRAAGKDFYKEQQIIL